MKLKKILKILCHCGIILIAYIIGKDIGGVLLAMVCGIAAAVASDIIFDCIEILLS